MSADETMRILDTYLPLPMTHLVTIKPPFRRSEASGQVFMVTALRCVCTWRIEARDDYEAITYKRLHEAGKR